MKALIGANLIDGTGRPVVNDSAILINGDRIESVGPRAAISWPEGTEVVDVSGKTMMPGMIDCHDHLASKSYQLDSRWGLDEPISMGYLRTAKALEETLLAGYTCVREAGGLVTDTSNGPSWLEGESIVAATPRVHAEIVATLGEVGTE